MTSSTSTSTTMATSTSAAPPNRSLLQDGPCAFECPICFGIPLDPVLTPECEHIFCKSCITQALHHSEHCPTCRAPLTHSQLKPLEKGTMLCRMWSQIPVKCRNSDVGCLWTGSVSEYQGHVVGCDECRVVQDMKKTSTGEEEEDVLTCEQQTKKQQDSSASSSSSFLQNSDEIEKTVMAVREKTWTQQLGVLERQQKNLEVLLEEQRKMISRLRKENEKNFQCPSQQHVLLKNKHEGSTCSNTTDHITVAPASNTAHGPTTTTTGNNTTSCDAVQVTGAGVAQVNGIYKRTGSWDNVGMFTKKGVWQDNIEQTFTLYRCNTYNNSKRWCISILPSCATTATAVDNSACTAVVDIDFYQQAASGIRNEVPGMLSSQWVSVRGRNGGNGGGGSTILQKDCPPSVTYLPTVV
jgi:RING-finger-containing E3 ubiquitin ligase